MQTKHRILLIDDQWGRADDPMIPGRYGQLSSFEWRLESAEESPGVYSPKKALKRVRKEQPAVVLLDIMFGGEQSRLGVEILENIRSEFPELPVIIFTSLESEENRELVVRCMEIGANEYLEKTPDATQMEAVLKVYTDGKSDHAIYGMRRRATTSDSGPKNRRSRW
jgi:CheY-like chemotaxis protein